MNHPTQAQRTTKELIRYRPAQQAPQQNDGLHQYQDEGGFF